MALSTMAASFASGAGYAVVDRMADSVTGVKRTRPLGERVDADVAAGGFAGGDYVTGRRSVWRRARWSTTRRKLNRELYNRYVFYWGRLTKPLQPILDATTGAVGGWSNVRAFQLLNWAYSTGDGAAEYPVHMFELTTRAEAATHNHAFAHALKETGTPGSAIGWTQLTGRRYDIATQLEYDSLYPTLWRKTLPGDMADVESAVLDRVVVDLTLQGCRNLPCTFYVKLVQFSEEGLEPLATPNPAANAFWRRVARRLIGHPAASSPPLNKNPDTGDMRVIKQFKYYIAPSNTTDNFSGPAIRRERLTFNLNRLVDFSGRRAQDIVNSVTPAQVDDPNVIPPDEPVATSAFNYLPDIRARMYLMISCSSAMQYVNNTKISWDPDIGTAKVGATAVTSAVALNTPQYDARFYLHYITADK